MKPILTFAAVFSATFIANLVPQMSATRSRSVPRKLLEFAQDLEKETVHASNGPQTVWKLDATLSPANLVMGQIHPVNGTGNILLGVSTLDQHTDPVSGNYNLVVGAEFAHGHYVNGDANLVASSWNPSVSGDHNVFLNSSSEDGVVSYPPSMSGTVMVSVDGPQNPAPVHIGNWTDTIYVKEAAQ